MSSFFLNIKNIFLKQKKADFEIIKNEEGKIRYKDKTFCFESSETKNNCFLSSYEDRQSKFLFDMRSDEYIDIWEKNDYSYPQFGFKKEELNPIKTYDHIKKLNERGKIFIIDENDWLNNWESILKDNNHKKLKIEIFKEFPFVKIKNYFMKNNSELLKEYEKIFEVHSISECIKNKMNYLFYDHNKKKYVEKKFEDLKIFKNKIDCTNIQQGSLGTCYFLEALSILSNYGQLLYQLFPEENIKEDGFYEICLYYKEEWYKILVDDYFIFQKRKNEKDPLIFFFTQPAKECLYSCFLEKAFAKIRGSYCDINGGYQMIALTALTGFDSLYFKNSKINKEFIEQMKIFLEKGLLLSGSALGHAYSILMSQDDYFIARNPWSYLRFNDKKIQEKYDEKKKLTSDLKNNQGLFKIHENDLKEFFNQGIDLCICLFGRRVYKLKIDEIKNIYKDKKLFFSFETFDISSNLFISLQNSLDDDYEKVHYTMDDEYSVKLVCTSNKNEEQNLETFNDFKKKALEETNKFNDFNYEKEIGKGKYLGTITFKDHFNFSFKILTIITDKNVNINFFNNSSKDIKYTNYIYGEKSAELRKIFKNIDKLWKHLDFQFPDNCHGIYFETILEPGLEAVYIYEKNKENKENKGIKRLFTFDKKQKTYSYKIIDEKGKETEEVFTQEQINDIKIHENEKIERELDMSFEKIESERRHVKRNLYDTLNKFEQDLVKENKLIIEEDYPSCFCNDIHYYLKLNENCLIISLKGNLINILKSYSCCEMEIMKIELKLKDSLINNYANIKKNKHCSFCSSHFDMNIIFEKDKNNKRFKIRKLTDSFEIYELGNLIFTLIKEGKDTNQKLYKIKNGNNEEVGMMDKADENNNEKNISYKIEFKENNKIDYREKIIIVFGGILIQN